MADLISTSDAKTFLGIATTDTSKDALLTDLVAYVSAAIRKYCARDFSSATATEDFDGGVDALILSNLPVTSIVTFEDREDGTTYCTPLYGESNSLPPLLRLDGASGLLRKSDGAWGTGYLRWRVTYIAGDSAVPDDVALAACKLTADLYFRPDRSINSESFGDYSYTRRQGLTDPAIPEDVKELLDPYVIRDL